jgi:hypothetical protein
VREALVRTRPRYLSVIRALLRREGIRVLPTPEIQARFGRTLTNAGWPPY